MCGCVCVVGRARVVAVVCNGQSWQFKDWPVSDPTELFVNGTRADLRGAQAKESAVASHETGGWWWWYGNSARILCEL